MGLCAPCAGAALTSLVAVLSAWCHQAMVQRLALLPQGLCGRSPACLTLSGASCLSGIRGHSLAVTWRSWGDSLLACHLYCQSCTYWAEGRPRECAAMHDMPSHSGTGLWLGLPEQMVLEGERQGEHSPDHSGEQHTGIAAGRCWPSSCPHWGPKPCSGHFLLVSPCSNLRDVLEKSHPLGALTECDPA